MAFSDALSSLLESVNSLMGIIDGKLRNKADRAQVYTRDEVDDAARTLGANAATASRLKVLRTLTLAGHAVGEVGFDGSGNVTMQVAIPGLASKAEAADVVTKTQFEAALRDLIGAAPEALNQLEEFARALANDPNFAQTMLTKLDAKADKSTTYTVVQVDSKFLQKTAQAADSAKLGGNAVSYFASVASVQSLDGSVSDALNKLAAAFTSGASKINGTGV